MKFLKTIISLTILFAIILHAEEVVYEDSVQYISPKAPIVSLYKTKEKDLTIDEIKSKSNLFKKVDENTSYFTNEINLWIKLELPKDLESGVYITQTFPFVFNKNSLKKEQLDINGSKYGMWHKIPFALSFKYNAEKDDKAYFFRVEKIDIQQPFQLMRKLEVFEQIKRVVEQRQYFSYSKENIIHMIIGSIIIGLILMSALYTAVIFSYTSKKEFIYYTLMQISMVMFLFTARKYFHGMFTPDFISPKELTLVIAFFATLFTQSFLDTKKYLPRINIALNLYLVILILDALWLEKAVMVEYKLYEVFGLLYLFSAILRIKDGFKVAWFYLLGWIGLLLCIFIANHLSIAPYFMMFIGVAIEAIMLAWALVYKMKSVEEIK